MKYKYEFEVDESFEKGCCYDCPFSYIDYNNDCAFCCALHAQYDKCPLEEVKE